MSKLDDIAIDGITIEDESIVNFTSEDIDQNDDKIRKQLIDKPELSAVCTSFKSLSILKFIIKRYTSNSNDIKLIFVGPREQSIVNILTKLEKNKSLSKSETDALSLDISYWSTKFGPLDKYDTYFIYSYIEENTPLYHVRIIIYDTLSAKFGLKSVGS